MAIHFLCQIAEINAAAHICQIEEFDELADGFVLALDQLSIQIVRVIFKRVGQLPFGHFRDLVELPQLLLELVVPDAELK